jgi:hypothetical protein
VIVQALGAPFGIGFGAAIAYFLRIRPKLSVARAMSTVAVYGAEAFA